MIKINLLRNLGMTQGGASLEAAGAAGGGGGAAMSLSDDAQKQVALKVAAFLVLPIALYIYEYFNLTSLQEALIQQQQKVQQIQAEKSKYGDTGPRVERFNKEKARVEKEIEAVRNLARVRLREVKALDALQSLMPNRTWVKKVSIEGNVVKLEGYSSSETGVTEFIRALENSVSFSRVEPKSTVQENLASGPVKRFEMDFRIGKQD